MTPQRETIEHFEALPKAAKELVLTLIAEEQKAESLRTLTLEERYEAALISWRELEAKLAGAEPLEPLLNIYKHAYEPFLFEGEEEGEEGANLLLQDASPYLFEGLTPREWQASVRRRIGPLLNGVKKWALRINLSSPWPEGPDLTEVKEGSIVIELRVPVGGTHQPGELFGPEGELVSTTPPSDYPWDKGFLDGGLEVQHGGVVVPNAGSGTLGTQAVGSVAH